MPLKKVDSRIRTLIDNGVVAKHRSLFVVVGDKGRDQVVILHHMMAKAVVKARPSVLWCYKKELGFSSHRKKRMKQLQKKLKSGSLDVKEDDPFELFIAATDIRYCYYADTHKILGNTYGMCVLQDFEALTPNLLARTVETVEGGGLVVLLLRTMTSLRQLCTMTMDVHARYRTEAHHHVKARFNERFLLSLGACKSCLVMDDQLNILPISSHTLSLHPLHPQTDQDQCSSRELELQSLQTSLQDTQPMGQLAGCCRTLDQAKALLKFVEAIAEQTLRSTVTLTAARGRGKSAALGLAIAAAISFGYSNIFVTSPSPENLRTLFDFVLRGFDKLDYVEHEHYNIVQSTQEEFHKAVVRINIFQRHRQTIQYIQPGDSQKLEQAELLCIDEAAAIPLPLVKKLLGNYLVFMASTVNGYEGTGRSLSLKLVEGLRQQSVISGASGGRVLKELKLEEPIRYGSGDPVEAWLHELLCLDVSNVPETVSGGCPDPQLCHLYHVNRDTLFCYHSASEAFLHQLMALYVSSHYKNSPNDLQLLSDAPAHHLFVLLGPVCDHTSSIPEVLCVLQVCLEGDIGKHAVMSSLARGKRSAGDLIPWTLSQQFADHEFASLSGCRIVRIATHPNYQSMGYGTRAIQQLIDYYSGVLSVDPAATSSHGNDTCVDVDYGSEGLLKEVVGPRRSLPPLLTDLQERQPEKLQYVGVAFGLTSQLLKFWTRNEFHVVYLRQTSNELTGEHSCIMLRQMALGDEDEDWLKLYTADFRNRFLSLLSYQFRVFSPSLALAVLETLHKQQENEVTRDLVKLLFSKYDLKRLDLYVRNMADYHLITDLLPAIARLYFVHNTPVRLSAVQSAILLGLGLQRGTIDTLEVELELPASQLLGLFNRIMHKFHKLFSSLEESQEAAAMEPLVHTSEAASLMKPIKESLEEELKVEARKFEQDQARERQDMLSNSSMAQYAMSGKETLHEAMVGENSKNGKQKAPPSIVSVRRKRNRDVSKQAVKVKRKK